MTDDPPGVASPRDPAGGPTSGAPRFRADVEPAERSAPGPKPRPRADEGFEDAPAERKAPKGKRIRARRVHRVVRHVDPWSVLKVSVLFFFAVFLIICVASAILWNAARSAGSIDKVEDFITDTGGFGNCPPVTTPTPTTAPVGATTVPEVTTTTAAVDEESDEDCPDGQELEGAFTFEDGKIFQAFALGGIVLVLAGAAGAVVLALLFNLMSDLTGGIRITVLEEEPTPGRTSSERARTRSWE